jgi:REP element-mobilizing transposase RayT
MRSLGGNVPHRRRPPLSASVPIHVTLVVKQELRLRNRSIYATLREAFRRGRERFGFRLCHFSIQKRRIHLLCEAQHRRSLWRGIQGLAVRIAKRLNSSLGRKGAVFVARYHARQLEAPRDVRNALRYVMLNHLRRRKGLPDPYSSGSVFKGWGFRPKIDPAKAEEVRGVVAVPRTRLLARRWRRGYLCEDDQGFIPWRRSSLYKYTRSTPAALAASATLPGN